ncbi:hypothetical protein CKO38_08850 [Rhodospirillum rubrum]|uniref:hypothetical protein n=1 Tax=Rhodospirillum rubrum TaxID=1085 RepID=UPI0019050044|nr:hypothetical protein [Rhodospirillum rubrum]MBK1664331.1 hypothetical protein [Rhodospirillum rubrum]MBK1676776.1 hypothetical protein [Rhodospirillum rubrum]
MRAAPFPRPSPHAQALLVLVCCLVGGPAALAADSLETTRRYGTGTAPYRQVGDLRKDLSALCRRGQFNQVKIDGLYIGYRGKDAAGKPIEGGKTITGIAKKGYNLFDPQNKAEDNVTYHFHNDTFSNCLVFEAKPPPPGP